MENFKWLKWMIVILTLVPLTVALILPTAILRVILVPLASLAEDCDDKIHSLLNKPLDFAIKWSRK